MILSSKVPFGHLRTDLGDLSPLKVYRPPVVQALGVETIPIAYNIDGIVVPLPQFLKLLFEGNIIAHIALWSPYFDGDVWEKEELLNQKLVDNLLSIEGTLYERYLGYLHAKSIVFERAIYTDREDWEYLEAVMYGKARPPMPTFNSQIESDKKVYEKILKSYYICH